MQLTLLWHWQCGFPRPWSAGVLRVLRVVDGSQGVAQAGAALDHVVPGQENTNAYALNPNFGQLLDFGLLQFSNYFAASCHA